MRKNVSKAAVVGIMGMAISVLVPGSGSVVSAGGDPPGSRTEGWFWTATQCTLGCDWDAAFNWTFFGLVAPPWDYPSQKSDDAYITWAESTPLYVDLNGSETIDALVVTLTYPSDPNPVLIQFASTVGGSYTLSCDHLSLEAGTDARLTIAVVGITTLKTIN